MQGPTVGVFLVSKVPLLQHKQSIQMNRFLKSPIAAKWRVSRPLATLFRDGSAVLAFSVATGKGVGHTPVKGFELRVLGFGFWFLFFGF